MLLSLLYTLLRVAFGGLIRIRGRAGQTDLENAVLRHQLRVKGALIRFPLRPGLLVLLVSQSNEGGQCFYRSCTW